jgi:hypothetical protein
MIDNCNEYKISLIRQIMAAKRYVELYEIVVGISKYNVEEECSKEMSDDGQRAWQSTMHHLEYLSKYGDALPMVDINGRKWFAHPKEFEVWLQLGAPGVSINELDAYLADFPV